MSTPIATTEPRQLRNLVSPIADLTGIKEVVESLAESNSASIDGVFGSARALVAAGLVEALAPASDSAGSKDGQAGLVASGMLAICADSEIAEQFFEDASAFGIESCALFPWQEDRSEKAVALDTTFGDRIKLIKQLIANQTPRLIVAPIQALMQPLPSAATISDSTRILRCGDKLDIDEFCQWLASHGFHATTAVELASEFSRRAGILDVFAPDWDLPIRIELFDDEIESIREFSLDTQRSSTRRNEVELTVLRSQKDDGEHLAAFLRPDTVVLQVEPDLIDEQMKQAIRLAIRESDLHGRNEVLETLAPFPQVTMARIGAGLDDKASRISTEPIEKFSAELGEMRMELDRLGRDHEIYLACPTEGDHERINEIFASTQVASEGRLILVDGAVHAGFRMVHERLIVLGCDQLLSRHDLRRPSRRRLGKAIDSFLDLREGDLIVHLAHGIGRYRGLKLLQKDGHEEEHLELEFQGGTRIYVPAAKIDLVQKYIGGARSAPKLAKIGGKSWIRQKEAAEQAVTDLASEMLEVQAARSSRPGIAHSNDTEWQHEFEHSFPYRETEDQLAAIRSIKFDMERAQSMDRLLCGDVGFGKTEVAMRAAFKAVENGFQVAVLVPTTVLVEQHYRTFSERMAGFPFDIAKLSRFCSTQDRRATLEGLKQGRIDIVIGTHRLASKDVEFFNLGVLVIDEEQRFGVEIKEKLKSMRTMVDVLTMSATPIPRTLHMSLVGVRDISNLESPPEERLAVETRISRFDDELIRNAGLRELERGGQIYFIHNRVNDIHLIRDRIQHILPEAKIGIAHGQMPESQLEPVMTQFINHELDVLLATTIVENGLDIPNANTIFINEADRYGLSDLHQLRGRVGRYKHRAYAYLLIEPHKHVSPNASKRLRAIEEFSDMGAGFAIAMRDLEIRGAGNLLGTEQSGHIAAIGYELYCQLLEKAVRVLKKMPPRMTLDVDVDLPVQAFLPDDYVTDKRHKIDFYRRMTRIERFEQIGELKGELADRFGPVPPQVAQLLNLVELKLEAAVWQIISVHLDGQDLVFKSANPGRLGQLAKLQGRRMRVADAHTAHVRLKSLDLDGDQFISLARSILRPNP